MINCPLFLCEKQWITTWAVDTTLYVYVLERSSSYIFRPFLQLYFKVGNSTNTYWYILLLLLLVDLPRHVTDSIGLSNQKVTRWIDSPSLLVLHPSMLEPEKCLSEVNFWCSSILDARSLNARCKRAFENRQILAKIMHFQSNTRAKARSCRIF